MALRFMRVGLVAVTLLMSTAATRAETLLEALTAAYVNNPNIMSALLSVKSAAEDIALRKAGKLPTISAGIDYSASWSVGGPNGSTTSQGLSTGLTYQHRLFDNFRTDAQIEQARALSELSKYALRNAEQNVLLSVAQAYMGVVRDTQLVSLREENVSFFAAQVNSASERLRIGEGTRLDVSQAEARQAQAVALYRAGIASLQTSQASYERWVGRKPRNLTSGFQFDGLVPASVDLAMSRAEEQNPAILTARASIRAAQAGADAADAAFGPTLDLIGSLCAIGCFGGFEPNMSGSVRLSLSVPLYSGGSLGASMRKANLETIRSEVDALATRDQVRESVISAWSTLQNATAQIESTRTATEAGQLVLEGVIQERDVGTRTTLDVLNAQAELTTARENLIVAQANRVIASFALIAATGRLSAEDLNLRVEIKSGDEYTAKVEDIWQELRSVE